MNIIYSAVNFPTFSLTTTDEADLQVVSIPDMKPVVKEIRHYITVCKQCGERIQSHAPRKRGSNAVVYDATSICSPS